MTEEMPKARPVQHRGAASGRFGEFRGWRVSIGSCPSARVNTNLLFTWRRRHGDLGQPAAPAKPALLPAALVEAASLAASPAVELAPAVPTFPGQIEIVLSNDRRVIVDAGVDGSALGRVLDVLERR